MMRKDGMVVVGRVRCSACKKSVAVVHRIGGTETYVEKHLSGSFEVPAVNLCPNSGRSITAAEFTPLEPDAARPPESGDPPLPIC
jgi:hypothetical protein